MLVRVWMKRLEEQEEELVMVVAAVAAVVVGIAGVHPDSDAYDERKHHHPSRRLLSLLAVELVGECLY